MSWVVPWDGVEYDIDPTEFTGLELSAIKQRTGLQYQQLLRDVLDLDGDAIRALFWTVARRTDPDLTYSEYPGPPLKVVIPHLPGLNEVLGELGKALTPATSGGPGSPNSTDTPETSTTD